MGAALRSGQDRLRSRHDDRQRRQPGDRLRVPVAVWSVWFATRRRCINCFFRWYHSCRLCCCWIHLSSASSLSRLLSLSLSHLPSRSVVAVARHSHPVASQAAAPWWGHRRPWAGVLPFPSV